MNWRTAVAGAVVCAVAACPAVAAAEDGAALYRLVILSDRTGGHTPGIYPEVIEGINLLNPDLVVTVGDHIEGYGEDYERAHAEWDSLLVLLRALEAPVYMTPGNHDIWDDQSEAIYREKTGRAPFYSFDHGGTHFVILDNSRLESWDTIPAQLFSWLLSDLRETDAENIFVFFHKPFWDQSLRRGKTDRLHEILVQYGVDAVFCGHYHRNFTGTFDGIEYMTVGSSGGAIYDTPQPELTGGFFQFAWVTVTETGHEVAIVKNGGVAPGDLITVDLLDEIERIEAELVSFTPIRVTDAEPEWTPFGLSVRNATDGVIEGAIEWTVPEGWEVEGGEAGLSIPAGEGQEIEFRALNSGALYPAPEMSIGYPLADGRTYDLELPVSIVRKATAARCEETPVIDGTLSDEFWRQSPRVTELYTGAGYSSVEGETEFLFGHDGTSLLVGARCAEEAMAEIQTAASERDGAVYLDDCVGFFLQPDPEEMVVYQIYVNAEGTVFDQRITFDENMWWTTDPTWNGEYQVATGHADDGWTAEIAIPFEALAADVASSPTWKVNFRRKQQRTYGSADWQVPIDYNPSTFGEMDFQ